MSMGKVKDKLNKILLYDQYAEEMRTHIPEEYGMGALLTEIVSISKRPICIYGAGKTGASVYLWLKEKGIQPKFFIDRKVTGELFSVPIYNLCKVGNEFNRGNYIVVIATNVSPYEQNMIKKDLIACGAYMVMLRSDLDVRLEQWSYDIIRDRHRIMECFERMSDDDKIRVFELLK